MPPVKEPRAYGGQSAEARSARRRDELIDAAFALVAEDGWRSLSIESSCRRAGLNKRYFYESFSDIDGVVAAIMERLATEAIATTLATIDPDADHATTVRRAITTFVHHLTDDPRRARVLFGAVPSSEAAAGHRASAIRTVIGVVATQGRELHALPGGPFVETVASLLVGGTSQAVLDWLDGRIECSRAEFVDELVALWLSVNDLASARETPG